MERPKYTLKEASSVLIAREPDSLLSSLAALGGVGLTFIVGGQVYSGSVVKYEEWLEAAIQSGLDESIAQQIRDNFAEPQDYPEDTPPLEEDERPEHEIAEELLDSVRSYLYLVNVSQLTSTGLKHIQ